jgi:hypothetical protein
VRDALEAVATGRVPDRPPSLPPPTRGAGPSVTVAPAATAPAPEAPAPAATTPAEDEAKLAIEERIAGWVRGLDDGKGAPWEAIVGEASKQGIGEADVEEAINSLLDKGIVYEPVLGRLKPT